ncbi:hypothetical protein C943_01306 [Mariniradius saccharolyticus AK6]|uniref:Uncharacterized protein n=1 Tax=Mariniradius saccharolyticus AK6 TaxID=1239962 RepID=M7XCH8_9BACT|nr:hypothetical protein C943_01306 [Mariniradius saccharolyticus AK6]
MCNDYPFNPLILRRLFFVIPRHEESNLAWMMDPSADSYRH